MTYTLWDQPAHSTTVYPRSHGDTRITSHSDPNVNNVSIKHPSGAETGHHG